MNINIEKNIKEKKEEEEFVGIMVPRARSIFQECDFDLNISKELYFFQVDATFNNSLVVSLYIAR